jgi:hypothetical protein
VADPVLFQLQGDSSSFTFDVEGGYFPRLEPVYKTAANPPEVVAIREVWEIRGARLTIADTTLSADAAAQALWAEWVALRARLATRGSAFPTYARFVRGASTSSAVYTLGPSTHEEFKVELMETTALAAEAEPGTWRTVVPVDLRVSAVAKLIDANGIVEWEQEVLSSYPDGRHRLEWRTRITTKEGTSAATKAASYAAIDASALGATYLYETNGSDGVDIRSIDTDEENSRTATEVLAVSAVRAFGTTIGGVTPGGSPSDVSYSITTRTTAREKVTTTTAEATGPNALQFVQGKKPTVYNEEEVFDEQAKLFARGVWTQREESNTSSGGDKDQKSRTSSLSVAITGGNYAIDFECLADDGDPISFSSAGKLPVVGTVDVKLEAIGPSFTIQEMLLPGDPKDDWILDAAASQEGEPVLEEEAADASSNKWSRSARLVFRRAKVPSASRSLLSRVRAAAKVASHLYG